MAALTLRLDRLNLYPDQRVPSAGQRAYPLSAGSPQTTLWGQPRRYRCVYIYIYIYIDIYICLYIYIYLTILFYRCSSVRSSEASGLNVLFAGQIQWIQSQVWIELCVFLPGDQLFHLQTFGSTSSSAAEVAGWRENYTGRTDQGWTPQHWGNCNKNYTHMETVMFEHDVYLLQERSSGVPAAPI